MQPNHQHNRVSKILIAVEPIDLFSSNRDSLSQAQTQYKTLIPAP